MDLIQIRDVLERGCLRETQSILCGSLDKSILIKPLKKDVCCQCIYRRLSASVVYDNKDYRHVDKETVSVLLEFLDEIETKDNNIIFEFKINGHNYHLTSKHFVLPVPGCKCRKV